MVTLHTFIHCSVEEGYACIIHFRVEVCVVYKLALILKLFRTRVSKHPEQGSHPSPAPVGVGPECLGRGAWEASGTWSGIIKPGLMVERCLFQGQLTSSLTHQG